MPSKSNFRWSNSSAARKRWAKIKACEQDIAKLAHDSWVEQRPTRTRSGMLKLPHPITVTITPYAQRQDANNLAKLVLDALEGVCYVNDRDVGCDIKPMKRDSHGARITIRVKWG